jgi:DNA-binding transcriptional LysR family regulator
MNPALLQLRLKHLQLLDLIHSTGSLRRAAGALYLTQPAVTAMLKELEHAFGNQLVARDSQGAALTAAGLALRVRLNALLDELRIASGEAGSQAPMRLRVGAMTAMMTRPSSERSRASE